MKLFYYITFLGFFLLSAISKGQITSLPEFPISNQEVKIIFDSKSESRLGFYTGDLYAHTGVGVEGKGDWQYQIGNWNDNTVQPKLTYIGEGKYELLITPSIKSFYKADESEKIIKMSFVFRSSDGSKQTNNLYIQVYSSGLNIDLQSPARNSIYSVNSTVDFKVVTSSEVNINLYVDNKHVGGIKSDSYTTSKAFSEPGDHQVVAVATNNEGVIVKDSAYFCVLGEVEPQTLPQGIKKGINYIDDNTVVLCLWAPGKENVIVLGDFNDWKPMNNYQMKKDDDFFWIQLNGLVKNKEYGLQYLIDGSINIADPYSEKISDPWNDKDIPESVYPDLYKYPEGKAEGIITVIQTGQKNYQMEVDSFQIPEKEKLVIYELLVRDFTDKRTYNAVVEKLDYLKDLGINAIELMPVNEFEGNISWGYNPSFYFASDKYYGTKNDLKKLIDECHKRGIAVIIDMVLNHSYDQSPLARMYWDNSKSPPSGDNPWYNTVSPNQTYHWGNDFNHESQATREFVDSVNSFWLNEYNVDGFRFDFTKGFTNKAGDGWAYDASRITILKRMADEIWERKPGALVICEHLAENSEEKELAEHGLMLWGNMNWNYGEAAMGYVQNSNSDLSNGVYSKRGWNKPNLVTYQESHDEERLTYKCLTWGSSFGDYNTKELNTAIERMKINAVFHLPLPGPKMIWQFGELGYDYSINTCEDGSVNDGCRLSIKPAVWEYTNDAKRSELFRVYADLNFLKNNYSEFSSENFSLSLSGAQKIYKLNDGENYVIIAGNFALEETVVNIEFPKTGVWYDYFKRLSSSISSAKMDYALKPGEYIILSTREFEHADINTVNTNELNDIESLTIYPNPAFEYINFKGQQKGKIEILNIYGEIQRLFELNSENRDYDISTLNKGLYVVKITDVNGKTQIGKLIKK